METSTSGPARPPAAPSRSTRGGPPTARQIAAVHAIMRLLVDDDVASGLSARQRLHCEACRCPRPLPGAVRYEPYLLCNDCATAYEVARLERRVASIADFLHGRCG